MSDDPAKDKAALEELQAAIEKFAHTQDPENFVVANSLVVWEQVTYSDGDVMARFEYTIPTTSTGSSALGLVVAADRLVDQSLFDDDED